MANQPTANPAGFSRSAEVFAWAMYDWANSAYSTILITVIMLYISKWVVPPQNDADKWGKTIYAWGISTSMLTAAVLSPIIGALADVNCSKRRWLAGTALAGAAGAILMAAVPPGWSWLIIALFILVSLCFELSLGVYNAFLPEISDEKTVNMVSAMGFALGYAGGAIALVLALGVFFFGGYLGVAAQADQLRFGVAIMGMWWGLFSLPAILVLRDRGGPSQGKQPFFAAAQRALREVGTTLQNIRRYRFLALFLLAFLLYNEGVQTVISQASVFASDVLQFQPTELILLILLIQILALPGAMLVGWLADRLGQKRTLIGCLAVWAAILLAAFFVQNKAEFWVLGGFVAMVMGGTQSVSRAIMGVMTPSGRTGEFFGFFNFSGKATSFLGPNLFGWILLLTGSARLATVSLLVFFLLGWALAARVNVAEGRRQAVGADV